MASAWKGSEAKDDTKVLDDEEEAPCGNCRKMVTNGDKGVWCEEVTPDVYRLLKKEAQDVHWYCKGCEKGVSQMLKVMSGVQVKVTRLEKRIEKI